MHDKLIPFDQGCEELGYSAQHIRRLIREGKLPQPIRLHPNGRPFWTEDVLAGIIAKRIAVAVEAA
jgi:predicted DNA-binding transcriptional regulator AlpA